jgi:lipopolysaccharide biosynthesis regulator YciM
VEKEQGEELAFARQKITELQQEIGRAKYTDDGYAAIADQRDNALQEIARLTEDCKGLSMSLNVTRENLVKSGKTIESKHGCWMNELAKVTALEQQLSDALPWRESCEKWQAECAKTDAQLATVTAERDRLQKPIAIASVLLSRQTLTGLQTAQTLHFRQDVASKDEMRGIAIDSAFSAKPGFFVDDVLVEIINLPPVATKPSEKSHPCFPSSAAAPSAPLTLKSFAADP